ncbi:GNAT family N-acetyltransferase [Bordetella genomosp. 1]|uniref:GNAT family N-acetyltransferase n=2 Tax=Bordetella genomosp. 1 TaxID=1395607 RepID=A0ABX4F3S6_9BORD|nr:GNAT family N-acetyltransferase [Bordetella genomosp. 1]
MMLENLAAAAPTAFTPAMQTRDALLARIEEAALNATAVREQVFYDGWLLRCAPSPARRMRSINILGLSTRALDDRLAYCHGWYARTGQPVVFRLTSIGPDFGLDHALAERGYEGYDRTCVMRADLTAAAPAQVVEGMQYRDVTPQVFAAEVGRLKGASAAAVAEHTARLAGLVVDAMPVVACTPDGTVVAAGLAVLEDDLVGIFDVVTDPAQRRQGHGAALVTQLLARATARGSRHAYLQVETDNIAARALYARFGFADCYSYWYRSLPAAVGK